MKGGNRVERQLAKRFLNSNYDNNKASLRHQYYITRLDYIELDQLKATLKIIPDKKFIALLLKTVVKEKRKMRN